MARLIELNKMNKELFDNYKKLSVTGKSELRFKMKDSPVGLSFLEFLDACTNRNFRNSDAVDHIYKTEKGIKPYAVLENRFFKLRKKINDEMESSSDADPGILPEEELELHRCKRQVRDGDKENAYQSLVALEKDCWAKNIFELLPAILDQLIFCNQSFNRLERNESLYGRLEKAIELNYDISRCMMTARKIYEINFKKGIRFAKKELELMKDLALKHKNYHRFELCYHHVSLYYKLGSTDYINEMQVISRHYRKFRELNSKYPMMPMIGYRSNYRQYQHFHFQLIAVFYHFNRCEFEEAYQAMKEMWVMMEESGSIFNIYKTESSYFNMVNSMIATERYHEADEIADKYTLFLKENGQSDRVSFAHLLKALVWCAAYPKIKTVNLSFLLSRIDEQIKQLKKNDNVLVSLAEAETLKAKIYFITGQHEKASRQLVMETVKSNLSSLGVYELYTELYSIARDGKGSHQYRTRKDDLKKKITSARYLCRSPSAFMQVRWLNSMMALI